MLFWPRPTLREFFDICWSALWSLEGNHKSKQQLCYQKQYYIVHQRPLSGYSTLWNTVNSIKAIVKVTLAPAIFHFHLVPLIPFEIPSCLTFFCQLNFTHLLKTIFTSVENRLSHPIYNICMYPFGQPYKKARNEIRWLG